MPPLLEDDEEEEDEEEDEREAFALPPEPSLVIFLGVPALSLLPRTGWCRETLGRVALLSTAVLVAPEVASTEEEDDEEDDEEDEEDDDPSSTLSSLFTLCCLPPFRAARTLPRALT